jgi:hypothetical protein
LSGNDVDGGDGAAPEIVPKKYNFDNKLTFTVAGTGTSEADFDLTTK